MNDKNDDPRWIERLRQLPKYPPVVDKLLLGASPGVVTDWLMQEDDLGPFSGFSRSFVYHYLIALKLQLDANSRKSKEKERTERSQRLTQLADEFTNGMTPNTDPVKQPEPIDEVNKATETQYASSTMDELTSDELVRLIVKMHLPHMNRMADWEKRLEMPHPGWEPGIEVLLSAVKILQQNESRDRLFATRSKAEIPVSEPQPLDETQRLAKLEELDGQRRGEAGEYVKNPMDCKIKKAQVN